MCEIPNAPGRMGQSEPDAGAQPEGWLQLAPPSVLRQIPPSFTARYCGWAVAITMSGFNDEIATSTVLKLGNPSRCCQLAPPSKVRKRPPVSVATTIRLSLFDATAIDKARPPCSTLGGVIVTGVGLQPARTASAANPAAIGGRRRSTRAFSQKSIDSSSKRRPCEKMGDCSRCGRSICNLKFKKRLPVLVAVSADGPTRRGEATVAGNDLEF